MPPMPKRQCRFKEEYRKEWPFIKKGRHNYEAECDVCHSAFSVGHGGRSDIKDHIKTTVSGHAYVNANFTRISRQINSYGCVLPNHPKFGQWSIYESTSQLHPGAIVPKRTILRVSCQDNYKLDGDGTIICIEGKWTKTIGECLKTCPNIYSTPVMKVTCINNNNIERENCIDAVDRTKAKFECADFYEDRNLDRNPVHLCFNGRWTHKEPECVPTCGQKSVKDPTLIVGGRNVTKGDYPWQVALYSVSDKDLLCGGSLINQRVVLTAAHCITNEKGKLNSKEQYVVAVGKYWRKYDDARDHHEAQFSSIEEMHIPKQYKADIQNYFGDIAILVTKTTFVLSTRVQPVCVDWGFKHPSLIDPVHTKHGYVTGWGYTSEFKNPSEVLKELQIPLINNEQCNQLLPEDYQKFMTDDKLCAGYNEAGISVCRGDSGGGLVTMFEGRYYVVAVVSLSPQAPTEEGGCDSQQYALYTNVSYYLDSFIFEIEARLRPKLNCEDDPNCKYASTTMRPTTSSTTTTTTIKPFTQFINTDCTLPEHPSSGQWSVFGRDPNFRVGDLVSSGTIIQITCKENHKLIGKNIVICDKGKWNAEIGVCSKFCPPLLSTSTTIVTCSNKDNKEINCTASADGAIAKHRCAAFYENLQADNPVSVCRNGAWDLSKSECVPICGKKSVTPQLLIINGNAAKKSDYPWHVAIYRGPNKRFICSGVLISQKLIVTAAHCVTNEKGEVAPKSDYTVAVGKYYRDFYDPLDSGSQFSEVQDIHIPLEYTGERTNYFGNIATIVAKKTFTLSERVQPVCVDWGSKYEVLFNSEQNLTGFISGWGNTIPSGKPADELQELQVPLVSRQKCSEGLPEDFRAYLSSDKICAGFINSSTSACSGDGGGPLVTNHEGRYYITGIVSTAPAAPDGGCNSQTYTLYTKVSAYNNFILEKDAQIRPTGSIDDDCRNNKNSNTCQTTTEKPSLQPETPKTSCVLPDHPRYGTNMIFGLSPSEYIPGRPVALGSVLQITCQKNYKLEADSVVLCLNGNWSTSISKCLRTCTPVYSTPIMTVTCIVKGKEIENCTEPTDGTRAKYECAPFYEDNQLAENPVHTCKDGLWDQRQPQCVPVCGQKSVTPQILIINGNTAKKGDYPWTTALYKSRNTKNQFICSGTLISERLILTAAQCVTDSSGKLHSKDQFTVAAGKYYQKFDDSRESSEVQFAQIHEIFVPGEYKGHAQQFIADIAILVTTQPFILSSKVQPVCLDWGSNYQTDLLNSSNNLTGYVTGWGFTHESRDPSDELQELEVPLINTEKCAAELPKSFLQYLTFDKFCAGHRNNSKAVCRGDSGGGLVVKFNGKFYIVGIVNLSPTSPKSAGNCDSQQYALYTQVSKYINNFILQKTIQYKT